MKHLPRLFLALLLPIWACAQENPGAVNGTVTLPLDRFLQLTRLGVASGSGGPAAPVSHLFPQGDYRVSVEERFVRVEAELSLSVYAGGWVNVDLFATPVLLKEARLDGRPLLTRASEEGGLEALVRQSGSHRMRLVYYLPLSRAGASRSFQLATPASAVSRVRLSVPGRDVEVSSDAGIPLQSTQRGGATVVTAALPGSKAVSFSWTPLAAHPALRGKPRQEKPRIYGRVFTLATVGEREVRLNSQLQFSILRNSVSRFNLRCPEDVEVVDVQGEHLASWSENDHRLEVRLSQPVSADYSLTVSYEKPLSGPNWNLPTLTVEDLERVKGSIGVLSTGGVELTQGTLQEARAIDVRELPAQVTGMASNPLMLAYEYHQQPFQIALASQRGEELPVLTAAVEQAEALTLVTEEGKLVSSFNYTLRNNRKQFLLVTLPPGASVFGAFVSGKAVKPIQDSGNRLRIPLTAGGSEAFPVELAYFQQEQPAGWLGSSHLFAPELDVPISRLNWTVYQPPSRHVYWVGGSLRSGALAGEVVAGGDKGAPVADQPAAAPEALQRKSQSYMEAVEGKVQSGEAYFKKDNRMANMLRSATQGALPVRLAIPRQGRVLEFSQLMITGGSPRLVLHYSHEAARWLGWGLVALATAGLGLAMRRRPRAGKLYLATGLVLMFGGLEQTPLGLCLSALWLGWLMGLLGWLAERRSPWLDAFKLWRHRRALTLLVLGLGLFSVRPVHAEGGGGGSVNLSLTDFLKLRSAHKPGGEGPSTAPVGWLVSAGEYRVKAAPGANWAMISADLRVSVLQKGWQEIDLLPAECVLDQALCDGQSVPVFNREARYHALVRGVGEHRLQLNYHLPLQVQGPATSLALVTPASQASSLRLVLPAGVRVSASPDVPLSPRGPGIFETAFTAPNLSLSWTSAAASAQLHGQARGEKARITARLFSLLSVSDTVARSKTRIDYQILRNEVDTLSLLVPAEVEVAEVSCENLANWTSLERGPRKQVNLYLNQPASGNLTVMLSLEKGLRNPDSTWDAPVVEVPGVDRMKGSLGVETSGGIEVSAATLEQVRAIDVAELPAELSSMCSNPTVLAYEYHRQPYRLELETHKGKEVQVLTATIDQGRGETLVTPDGKLVTHLTLSVRNNHKQYLELSLPARAEVWSTFVNGRAVKPIKAGPDKVRLRLESSEAPFPAEITYVQQQNLRPWLGHLDLSLPRLDMPVSDLGWRMFLPEEWKVLRLAGSMKPADGPLPAAVAAAPADPAVVANDELASARDRQTQLVSAAQQGVLPVRVAVPQVGQALSFQRLMVTDESPRILIQFTSRPALQAAGWLTIGFSLMLGAWLALKPRGWMVLLGGYLACRLGLPGLSDLQLGLGIGLLLWVLNHGEQLGGLLSRPAAAPAASQPTEPEEPLSSPVVDVPE